MLDVNDLKQAFIDKLSKTGSFDQAFTKTVWLAFKAGIAEKEKQNNGSD